MRIRRHFTSLGERGIAFDRRRALTWLGLGAGAVLAGYLTAYLILFPAPILPGHQAVPRVLGLTVTEAQAEISTSMPAMPIPSLGAVMSWECRRLQMIGSSPKVTPAAASRKTWRLPTWMSLPTQRRM